MEQMPETVVRVGTEGGTVTLTRARSKAGDWQFLVTEDEGTLLDFLSDEDRAKFGDGLTERGPVATWEEALVLLDRNPWAQMIPDVVHEDFRLKVWAAVVRRQKIREQGAEERLNDSTEIWRSLCFPLLDPFFSGEGGYVHLLRVLLTSGTPYAGAFRRRFSVEVLEPADLPRVDQALFEVFPEHAVVPSKGRGQVIDLVLRLPTAIIGIEAKLFESSFRQNQVAHQYQGLREQETEASTPVHMILISPKATNNGLAFDTKPGDLVRNVTWDQVLACCSGPGSVDPDVLLGAVVGQARAKLESLRNRLSVTVVTRERALVRKEVEEAIRRFNDWLSHSEGDLAGCSWKRHFSPRPTAEYYENGLNGPDGMRRQGQYLSIILDYRDGVAELLSTPAVTVAFTLPLSSANRQYWTEWDEHRNDLLHSLPTRIVDRRGVAQEGNRVQDQFSTTVRGDEVFGPDGRRLQDSLAELLQAYAKTFGRYLLHDLKENESK